MPVNVFSCTDVTLKVNNQHDSTVTAIWFQVQTLLQQMQDRFQATSDQVLARNIFFCCM